ncbi:MAG TPA: hypothetical protein VG944_11760 [Fimbriimonas sp.]|nr:hypothetical protein [Fimbriimonas sp.]
MTRDEAILLSQHGAASPGQSIAAWLSLAFSARARQRSRAFRQVTKLFQVALVDDDASTVVRGRHGFRASAKLAWFLAALTLVGIIAWHDVSSGALQAFLANGFGASCK